MLKRRELYGVMLENWRKARKLSQLELALRAGTSQRNLSFVESGRTHPSREMVLKVAEALDLPLRVRNEILLAAGYAPVYGERSLEAGQLMIAEKMLLQMLEHHEPYPAYVLDSEWNLVMYNKAIALIIKHCVAEHTLWKFETGGKLNFLKLMCAPDGFRASIRNWSCVGNALLARVRREAAAYPGSPSERLLGELLAENLFPPFDPTDAPLEPIISVEIEVKGVTLRLVNALTTFGSPQDVTLQELRIETSFPADEETAAVLRLWHEEGAPSETKSAKLAAEV
jgi:transcriptional regulator with XRE-family HTH domain